MRPDEEFLGVDVGAARVGVARGSTAAKIAEPLATLEAEKAVEQLGQLANKHQAAGVIVGLPRNLDGQDTDQTEAVRQWVKQAKAQINLPFFWQDEALTSQLADQQEHPAGSDAVAAAILLQDFLDTPAEERVRC